MFKYALVLLYTLLVANSLAVVVGPSAANAAARRRGVIPGRFLVRLKSERTGGVGASFTNVMANHENWLKATATRLGRIGSYAIRHKFNIGSKTTGYSAQLSDAMVNVLRANPMVEVIPDQYCSVTAFTSVRTDRWGLDRVQQTNLPLDGFYRYNISAGNATTVYILDTGVNIQHKDIAPRIIHGKNFVPNSSPNDIFGHGTHVAGIIGGTLSGVAKSVRMVSVKVLDDSGLGSFSDVIAALSWVATHCPTLPVGRRRCIVNLSLVGGEYPPVDVAVNEAVAKGIVVVAAAGNENDDAAKYSPARAVNAITVAASEIDDKKASYSNWGATVDIFAPGSNILSCHHMSKTSFVTYSGTSMAAPHVAGVLALYWSSNLRLFSRHIRDIVVNQTSIKNKIPVFWSTDDRWRTTKSRTTRSLLFGSFK